MTESSTQLSTSNKIRKKYSSAKYNKCKKNKTTEKSIRGTQRQTTTHTPSDDLETPNNLTCMLLDGGRRPEYPERTRREPGENPRTHRENMPTPHRKAPAGNRIYSKRPFTRLGKREKRSNPKRESAAFAETNTDSG